MTGGGQAPALIRLALSRERLRLALGGAAKSRPPGTAPVNPAQNMPPPEMPQAQPPGALASGWLDRLLATPMAHVLVDGVSGWWKHHPLRPVAVLASAALAMTLKPVAQRHPLALVAAAMLTGGLLAWVRPWRPLRWAARPALLAGLGQHLLSKALAEVPLQAWLTAWAALSKTPETPTEPRSGEPQSSSVGS